jgi:hypothetical protein
VTTVIFDPEVVPVLLDTVKVQPVAPARVTAPDGMAQATFPIDEVEGKVIEHTGGLQFVPVGGGSLRITEFDVDLNTGFLTARATSNGKRLPGRVDIFELGPVQPVNGEAPSCTGTPAGLTLTSQAAAALGAPALAGTFIGDACVVPGHHGDDDGDDD